MRLTGPDAEHIIALREQARRDRAAAAAERAAAKAEEKRARELMSQATAERDQAAELAAAAQAERDRVAEAEAALIRAAGLARGEAPVQAALAAGRWDRDPVRPNPGPGTWMDPGPVAAPQAGSALTPRMRAGLGLGAPAARSPDELGGTWREGTGRGRL